MHVVISTPRCSSRTGEPPFDENVMTELQSLSRHRRNFKIVYDFANSSTFDPRDPKCNTARCLLSTYWFASYKGRVKGGLMLLFQQRIRFVDIILIKGGLVTQVEHKVSHQLVREAVSDAIRMGMRVEQHNIRYLGYGEFLAEFDKDKPVTPDPTCQ